MAQHMQFIRFSLEQARNFIREIMVSWLREYLHPKKIPNNLSSSARRVRLWEYPPRPFENS